MAGWIDPYRPDSRSRTICEALERAQRPLTQSQLAKHADATVSWVCKCLKRLSDDGYVRRSGLAMRRNGAKFGTHAKLYVRTAKELPALEHPEPPTPKELCDIMNSIIRRNVAEKRK